MEVGYFLIVIVCISAVLGTIINIGISIIKRGIRRWKRVNPK